eukprot:142680_1
MADAFEYVTIFIYFHFLLFIKSQYVILWYDGMNTGNAWNVTNPAKVGIVDGDYWQTYANYCYDCYYDNPCPHDSGVQSDFCVSLEMQNGVGAAISRLTDISYYKWIRLQFDIGAWHISSTANECQVFYAYDSVDNKTLLYSQSKSNSDPWAIPNVIIDLPSSPHSTLLWIFLESLDGGQPSTKAQTCYWDDVYLKGTPLTVNPTINLSVYTVNPSVYTVNSSVSPSNNPSVYPTVNPTVSDIISTNIEWQKDDKTTHDTNRMQSIEIGSIIIATLLCVIFIGWVIYRTKGKRIIQKSIENNANPQQEHRPTTNRGDMATSLGAFIAERAKNTTVDHVNQIEGRRRVKKQTKSKENETEKYTVEGPGPQVAVDLQQYTDEGDGMYGV